MKTIALLVALLVTTCFSFAQEVWEARIRIQGTTWKTNYPNINEWIVYPYADLYMDGVLQQPQPDYWYMWEYDRGHPNNYVLYEENQGQNRFDVGPDGPIGVSYHIKVTITGFFGSAESLPLSISKTGTPHVVNFSAKREDGHYVYENSYGSTDYWNGDFWEDWAANYPLSSVPYPLTLNEPAKLKAGPEYISNPDEKFHHWEPSATTTRNYESFNIDQFTSVITWRANRTYSNVVIQSVLDNVAIGGFVEFKDPWLVDVTDSRFYEGLIGFRNQGMNALFKPETSPFAPSVSNKYKGVFLNQVYDPQNPQLPYYSIRAQVTQTINGFTSYFQNWSTTNVQLQQVGSNPSGYDQKAAVFANSNATVAALYKAHLGTGSPVFSDGKNQRRAVSSTSSWAIVYESMGDVWITYSGDNGSTWSQDQRLNTIIGQASNPTISNVVSGKAAVAWIENNQGIGELHLQTMTLSGGESGQAIWWGWNPGSGQRNSNNHTTVNALPLGQGGSSFTWLARLDSRPVLSAASDQSSILFASERNGSGIMTATVIGPSNFTSAYVLTEGLGGGGRAISANGSDKYPVIISYPSAYGYPASTRIFYLAAGYASGLRIAQYDYSSGSTSLVSGEYGEYTYYSLQGSSNISSASFVLVAEDYNSSSGYHHVCVFSKPTYYGNSLPSLNTSYTNTVQPAIMVDNGGFGSPSYEVNMKSGSDASWYKGTGGSPSYMGTSAAGIFAREVVASGSHASMVVRTTTTPSIIQYYSGSGVLQKTSGSELAVKTRAFRLWKDREEKETLLVLDFSKGRLQFLDTLENSKNICVARLADFSSDGILVAQIDSLATDLAVELLRGGNAIASFLPSRWNVLGTRSITGLSSGDILRFSLKAPGGTARGYTEYSILNGAMMKADSVSSKERVTNDLKPVERNIAVYPNPFNPTTTFRLTIPTMQKVRLTVYNLLGQAVATLADGEIGAGEHFFRFNGASLASGMYIYRVEMEEKIESGRLMLVK